MDDDELERFSFGKASEEETEQFEEHLLICDSCRERFQAVEEFVLAMRSAGGDIRAGEARKRSRWQVAWLVPAFAGLVLIAVGILAVSRHATQPLAVVLTATRGTVAGGTAQAGRVLNLSPDLSGIADRGPYRLEVVDDRGVVTWRGRYDAAKGAAAVPAQRDGTHFVRVYTLSGELLREYALVIQR
ncbi:MAG: zf-HC2 domain-containing protein [Acidobacteria bacterium]|nr:zf-HC2 domain-containing protein [Acidobacteriota bacterium]